jgi:hypothetical protein
VKAPRHDRLHHGAPAGIERGVAADQQGAVAACDLGARAADRAIEERAAARQRLARARRSVSAGEMVLIWITGCPLVAPSSAPPAPRIALSTATKETIRHGGCRPTCWTRNSQRGYADRSPGAVAVDFMVTS